MTGSLRVLAGAGPAGEAPQRILLVSAAGLGDFVMATPALGGIRRRFPQARIWILTIPEVRSLAERCPYVDAVRTLDLRRWRSALAWALWHGWSEVGRLIQELRSVRFDMAVNLYAIGTRAGGLRMAAFLQAVGARCTVGRYSGGRGVGFDLTSRVEGHEIDAQLGVARLIGATPTSEYPELWVTAEDRAACARLLYERGIGAADPVVCLHPGSARPEARWPAERFALVGRRLAEVGARVLLIGAQGDRASCASLARAVPGGISLAGETSLPVLAALLQRAAMLVTNDSGPMHMAAALGTPLVAAFGPATPDLTGPRGRAPCLLFAGTERPGGPPWWEGVPAETVSEAAVRLFAQVSVRSEGAIRDA